MKKIYLFIIALACVGTLKAQTIYKYTFNSGNKTPTIMLSNSGFELPFSETLLNVSVISNVDFQVVSNASWIKLINVKKGHLKFKISENKTSLPRTATVDISNVSGSLKKMLTITQTNYVNGDVPVLVSSASVTDYQQGTGIEKTYDGDFTTLYHSSWSGTTLPVTMIYNFTNASKIDYLVYTPRPSNSGPNGNFNAIDVYYKLAGSTAYVKYNSYTLNGSSSPYKLTFTGGLLNPESIKFVVNSGTNNFASCAEMQFFAQNKGLVYKELLNSKMDSRIISSWLTAGGSRPDGESLNVNSLYWTKNGKPWLPVMGEFHYVRYPQSGWEDEIMKMKASGISVVSTYVFWVNHESPKGTWSWTGDNDLKTFIDLCKKHGMYVWLRPGPYINAEAKNGGLPDWINITGKRTNADWYLTEVKSYFSQVAKQTKGQFYKDGGPIIGMQIENEFASGDTAHMSMLLKMLQDSGMVAPFNTVTNNSKCNYTRGNLLPLQGAYPYRGWGSPQNPSTDYLYSTDEWNAMENIGGLPYDGNKFPRGMAEMGVACWQSYGARFVVPVYGSEGHLQNCLGRGINLVGYYMFQGGTQKSGFQGGGQPLTYDFQAPLGEYGQVRPSYHALKLIHNFLNDFGQIFAPMQPIRPENMNLDPKDTLKLRYAGRFLNDSGFVFLTNVQSWVNMTPKKNIQLNLKLKSDTILFPLTPFTLKPNIAPIFPVNFSCNGSLLKYATAQLLCKVEDKSIPHYFFFAIDGIMPEFAFENSSFTSIVTDAKKLVVGKRTVIFPQPGMQSALTVTGKDGKQAVIVLLTRKQAEQSWRFYFRGKDRLLLSDANLLMDGTTMEVTTQDASCNVYSFPVLSSSLSTETVALAGIFSRHTLAFTPITPSLTVTKVNAQTSTFTLASLPGGVKDVFANVNYIGSQGTLSIDGIKYSDDYYNGTVWSIGLKRFVNGQNRIIKVSTSTYDTSVTGIPLESQPKSTAESAGLIRSITFSPEYVIRVQ